MMYVHLPFYSCLVLRILFREMWLRAERNDPRCTLFYTYRPAALKNGPLLRPAGLKPLAEYTLRDYHTSIGKYKGKEALLLLCV